MEVLEILGFGRVDVARDVEVEVVLRVGDLGGWHHTRVAVDLNLLVEDDDDLVQVLASEPILGAVLREALGGVDHEDASSSLSVLLVAHHDARRHSSAVKEIGWQADDSLDVSPLDQRLANRGLGVATEKHAVREDDCGLASALEGLEDVQEEGVIPVLFGRSTELEAAVV